MVESFFIQSLVYGFGMLLKEPWKRQLVKHIYKKVMRNFKPVLRNVEYDMSIRTGNTKQVYKGLHQYYTMEEFEALIKLNSD